MKRLFLMLLATVSLIACDKGDETPKPIELTGDTQTSQTIYADETQKSEGIKFKATAPWTAAVSEVTSKANDKESWLRLSAYEGGAGDVTLAISLDQNDTGGDRKAEIRIICGGTTITIVVEQKATTESGDIPKSDKLITQIERIDHPRDGGVRGSQLTKFFYDNLNRVSKMVVTETEIKGEGSAETTTTFILTCPITYTDNTVSYAFTLTKDGVPDGMEKGEITIDNNGRAISGKGSSIAEKSDDDELEYTYSLEYNGDGYLSKSERIDSDNPNKTDVEKLTWTNGNLVQVWWGINLTNKKDRIDKAIYGTVLNKTNLDLNWFYEMGLNSTEGFAFAYGDSENIFSLLGYVGKRAENLAEQLSDGYEGNTDFEVKHSYVVDANGYPTTIERSRKNVLSLEWEKRSSYKITYNK